MSTSWGPSCFRGGPRGIRDQFLHPPHYLPPSTREHTTICNQSPLASVTYIKPYTRHYGRCNDDAQRRWQM